MSEEEAKAWVKDKANQQTVIERFFADYEPREVKQAIFMAGVPGAGKTEFAVNMNKAIKLAPIEHDKLVEYIDGYKPENYYDYRKAGSVLVTLILNECLKRGYGFIFDGTLSHEGGYRNLEKAFKKSYSVQVIYIVQNANMAWQLTRDRELVKKRAIERSGFIETCNKINTNLFAIFSRYKEHKDFSFILFDKNGMSDMSKAKALVYARFLRDNLVVDESEQIEKALKKSYNVKELG